MLISTLKPNIKISIRFKEIIFSSQFRIILLRINNSVSQHTRVLLLTKSMEVFIWWENVTKTKLNI